MESYRGALAAHGTIPQELTRIGSGAASRPSSANSKKKTESASPPK
jgi:hypothetical protein